ncbi:MAG: MBL fold metallo-hydrolase [Pseudomonadota bacterium]
MRIKCWGSRGSIPVCGAEYLKYGGDTTCMEIQTESGEIIIVDAGTGIRRLGNHLMKENILKYHFIFTHSHWDHLIGFPFFKPLYSKDAALHMHRCPFQKTFVETMLSKVMTPPNFPIRYADVRAKIEYEKACPSQFDIGSVSVIPIPISHPNSGSGYKFIENDKKIVFLTDNELGYVHPNGLPFEAYRDFCEGADLLIHDAEYTPEEYRTTIEWGHSVYTDVLKLAIQAGVKRLGLFHINQERTDPQMDVIVAECNQRLIKQGSSITCFAVAKDMAFESNRIL